MKSTLHYFGIGLVSFVAVVWLSACGKKQDDSVTTRVRGQIATDGVTASTEGLLNGQLVRISVNRMSVNQGVGNPTGMGQPPLGPVVVIDLTVNGIQQSLQYQINPYSYNTGNIWQWQGGNTMMQTQVGGLQTWYEARCDSYTCEHMWLNLVVSGQSYYGMGMSEVKQIGLYRINSQNRLAAALESTTQYSQALQTNQLIQELNNLSQQ